MEQLRSVLAQQAGSKFPVKITRNDGEVMIRYIRGFADAKSSILLLSDTSYSLALKILELKEIVKIEFASRERDGEWTALHVKAGGKLPGFKKLPIL